MRYDTDYKAEVLKMLASGQSATQIAKLLGMSENLIYRWKSEQKESKPELIPDQDSLRAENEQLRQKLKRVEAERDILKKLSPFSASPARALQICSSVGGGVCDRSSL